MLIGAQRSLIRSSAVAAAAFTPASLFTTYGDGFWLVGSLGTCTDEAGTTPTTSDAAVILNWKDQSGFNRHFSRAAGGPIRKNSIINGEPVLRWTGNAAATFGLIGATIASWTSAEVFIVIDADQTGAGGYLDGGIWSLGTAASPDHYAYSDNNAYMGAFSTVRKSTGDPTPALDSPHLLNIYSASNDWNMLINGTSHFSTATNTFGAEAAPRIGQGRDGSGDIILSGDIAEVCAFPAKVTAGERTNMKSYLATKYNITVA